MQPQNSPACGKQTQTMAYFLSFPRPGTEHFRRRAAVHIIFKSFVFLLHHDLVQIFSPAFKSREVTCRTDSLLRVTDLGEKPFLFSQTDQD